MKSLIIVLLSCISLTAFSQVVEIKHNFMENKAGGKYPKKTVNATSTKIELDAKTSVTYGKTSMRIKTVDAEIADIIVQNEEKVKKLKSYTISYSTHPLVGRYATHSFTWNNEDYAVVERLLEEKIKPIFNMK